MFTTTIRNRFWSKVNRTGDCWNWIASKKNGYGQFTINRHPYRAHRIAYLMEVGPIVANLYVCHRCDNRACVNPSHLFLATAKENTRDAISKGRILPKAIVGLHGESSGRAKLTNTDVLTIRYLAGTMSQRTLAKQFGIGQTTVGHIIHNRTWTHI